MKYVYEPETFGGAGSSLIRYAVRRSGEQRGERVATCYVEENARLVVNLLNRGVLAPHLAIALERLWAECPEGDTDNRKAALVEAARALDEWNQLTKTPPGTE